jgi:hypothetical protein
MAFVYYNKWIVVLKALLKADTPAMKTFNIGCYSFVSISAKSILYHAADSLKVQSSELMGVGKHAL